MCIYIFSGRFQPFHNGHMHVFNELCKELAPTDTLVLGVVAPFQSDDIKDRAFSEASEEHHLPDRNPWNLSVPLSAVSEIAHSSHYRKQIITTLLPRPDYGWDTITSWFPGKRVWVIPLAGEEFDDKKSEFFKKMGDQVKRVTDTTGVSGRKLREFYANGQYKDFASYVPERLADIYFREEPDNSAEIDFQKRAKEFEKRSKWVVDEETNNIPTTFFAQRHIGELLDAGGGTGYLSYYLYQHLKDKIKSISIVDISRNMLDEAEKKYDYPILTYNSSIETFCQSTTRKFDSILMRQVFHYVGNVDIVIKLLKKVLNDNGIIYVGQILVEDEECKIWHDELMKEISKNRRRTFVLDDFVKCFKRNGFEVISCRLTDFEECFSDLYNRRVNTFEKKSSDLISKMKESATDSIKEKMSIRFENGTIYYTVKFCHLFLRKNEY